jgi:hypothetical protein
MRSSEGLIRNLKNNLHFLSNLSIFAFGSRFLRKIINIMKNGLFILNFTVYLYLSNDRLVLLFTASENRQLSEKTISGRVHP